VKNIVFAEKQKVWKEKPHFFPKILKEATSDYFFICLRQVSNERIQASIIHIPPCSQKIIDNEIPDFFTFFF
jgi:hypothetical protein